MLRPLKYTMKGSMSRTLTYGQLCNSKLTCPLCLLDPAPGVVLKAVNVISKHVLHSRQAARVPCFPCRKTPRYQRLLGILPTQGLVLWEE
jgi:hypothetical protein